MFKRLLTKVLHLSNDLTVKLLLNKIDSLEEDIIDLNVKIQFLEQIINEFVNEKKDL
jgi:hypothetical protein